MIELKLTVDIPALDRLIPILEKYHEGRARLGITDSFADGEPTVAPYTAPDMPLPTPVVAAGIDRTAVPHAPAPAPVAPPVAPVTAPTAAPSFTLAQVSTAGAELITAKPAVLPQLAELLGRYGAKTLQDVPEDKLGEIAGELRKLGARI